MYDSPEVLLQQIHCGEDSTLELKTVRFKTNGQVDSRERNQIADELAAIANSHGGVLVFGVDDRTRDIVGIPEENLDFLERFVYEICEQSINPPLHFLVFRLPLPDTSGNRKVVMKVEIPRSLFVHKSPGGYMHRQGSSKREMSSEYLARMFQQRSQGRMLWFDEQTVPQAGQSDLSKKLWEKYVPQSSEPAEISLHKLGLLSKEESGSTRPSVAGVLFCCEQPDRFLPAAQIDAVRYRGIRPDSNYQIDAQTIRGPLPDQIKQAMAFLERNQSVSATKPLGRIDRPQFSRKAVFEAIVNAVAHRDYSIHASRIRFFIFDDRLEIYSPGSLPNTVTVENMELRQVTRNELIVQLLRESPVSESIGAIGRDCYMERRGEGVPAIYHESEQLSGKKPTYSLIDEAELLLTIFSA